MLKGGKLKWNSFYLQLEVSGSFVSGLWLLGFLFPTINKISDLPYVMKKPVVYHYKYKAPPPKKKVALILDSFTEQILFHEEKISDQIFLCIHFSEP